jgi:hypothetical protein
VKELLDGFDLELAGSTVLLVAPDAESLGDYLRSERGAASVEVLAAPPTSEDRDEQRVYDVAAVGDVLYLMSASAVLGAMRWIRDHLRPGGECLVETRTYLGRDGAGLAGRLRTPYAHLAFARDAIEEYYAGQGWAEPRATNYMCRATYLVLFRRAGLVPVEVRVEHEEPQAFEDKLQWYDPDELRASRFLARLRRADEAREVSELRLALMRQ